MENIHPNSRNCQYENARAASPVCSSKIASIGSDARTSRRTASAIDPGGTPATRIVNPVFLNGSYGYGTNAYGDGLPSRTVNRRKSPTVPMTVIQSACGSLVGLKRWPTTFARFGQRRLANTWFTIATRDLLALSMSVKSRPDTTGWPSVRSRCGVTAMYNVLGSLPGSNVVPSGTTPLPAAPPLNGTMREATADCTPGNCSTRRTMSSTRRIL